MASNLLNDETRIRKESVVVEDDHFISYTAVLLTQGNHRFYTLAMPSEVLAETCVVDPRVKNPLDGFQRLLDKMRAQDIADYIDSGFGTIPSSIILSAHSQKPNCNMSERQERCVFAKRPVHF